MMNTMPKGKLLRDLYNIFSKLVTYKNGFQMQIWDTISKCYTATVEVILFKINILELNPGHSGERKVIHPPQHLKQIDIHISGYTNWIG